MLNWTLDELLQECATNTYNQTVMVKSGTAYSGQALEFAVRFLSGINYAVGKIAREKYAPMTTETVVLDATGRIPITSFNNACLRVLNVQDNHLDLEWTIDTAGNLFVPGYDRGIVTVTYGFIPVAFSFADLTARLAFPFEVVDPHLVCQYADYQFLIEDGTQDSFFKANFWLSLFNDSFASIDSTRGETQRVYPAFSI